MLISAPLPPQRKAMASFRCMPIFPTDAHLRHSKSRGRLPRVFASGPANPLRMPYTHCPSPITSFRYLLPPRRSIRCSTAAVTTCPAHLFLAFCIAANLGPSSGQNSSPRGPSAFAESRCPIEGPRLSRLSNIGCPGMRLALSSVRVCGSQAAPSIVGVLACVCSTSGLVVVGASVRIRSDRRSAR